MRSPGRNIVLVSHLDGMPYDEIARGTGLSVEQVQGSLTRTLLRLRRVNEGEPVRWWWLS